MHQATTTCFSSVEFNLKV